jgi:hypothetical protein
MQCTEGICPSLLGLSFCLCQAIHFCDCSMSFQYVWQGTPLCGESAECKRTSVRTAAVAETDSECQAPPGLQSSRCPWVSGTQQASLTE